MPSYINTVFWKRNKMPQIWMKTFDSHNKSVQLGGLSVFVIILQKMMKVTERNKTSEVEATVEAQS